MVPSQASMNLVLGSRFLEVKSAHKIGLRIVLCMVTQHRLAISNLSTYPSEIGSDVLSVQIAIIGTDSSSGLRRPPWL